MGRGLGQGVMNCGQTLIGPPGEMHCITDLVP